MHIAQDKSGGILGEKDIPAPVLILGCGATGSVLALQLVTLGVKHFILCDGDVVEHKNTNNQAFCFRHIGMFKTDALEQLLLEKSSDLVIEKVSEYITPKHKSLFVKKHILFFCVDRGRKALFSVISRMPGTLFIISTGLAVNRFEVFFSWRRQFEWFASTLPSEEVETTIDPEEMSPCGGAAGLFPVVTLAASYAANLLITVLKDPENAYSWLLCSKLRPVPVLTCLKF